MRRISLVLGLLGLASLVGCYASEKMGKDIQDTSHDVNQGGIYMHKGGLGVYRPEPKAPELTSASMTKAPAANAAPVTAPPKAAPSPQNAPPAATQWPAAPPVSAHAPAPSAPRSTPPLPNASDAGIGDVGAFSL